MKSDKYKKAIVIIEKMLETTTNWSDELEEIQSIIHDIVHTPREVRPKTFFTEGELAEKEAKLRKALFGDTNE